jgi:hypothetical protein
MRPLAETLDLVAREVADLARMADRLERVIQRLAADGVRDPAALMDAQAADLLTQRLDGLAAFVGALAGAAAADVSIDVAGAARRLPLADQARRLTGAPAPAVGPESEAPTFWD